MNKQYQHIAQPWSQRPNAEILPVYRNETWFYAHHPLSWELIIFDNPNKKSKTKRIPLLLPLLQKISHIAGVNGVRDGGDLTIMNGQLSRDGWVILHPNKHDYMQVYNAIGGKYYAPKFMDIQKLANRVIKRFDQDKYNAWRKSLIVDGHVELPHDHVLQLMDIEYQEKINATSKDQHLPHMAKRKKDCEQKHKDLLIAIETIKQHGIGNYVDV